MECKGEEVPGERLEDAGSEEEDDVWEKMEVVGRKPLKRSLLCMYNK